MCCESEYLSILQTQTRLQIDNDVEDW